MKKEVICTACPMGCHILVERENGDSGYHVTGNTCRRGETYAVKEVTAPERTLTTTVKILKSRLSRLPVVTDGPVLKGKMFDIMEALDSVEAVAPVHLGDVIVSDVAGTGVNIIASRSMDMV